MRKVILIIVAAALVWSGYWFVGAAALNRGLDMAMDELRAADWRIETADRRLRGFPNRFDTTFDAPEIVSPDGMRLTAPFFQLLALSYRPNEVIAIFPPEMTIEGSFGTVRVAASDARGSITLQTATSLPLDHSSFVVEDLAVATGRQRLLVEEMRFATRIPLGAPDARHQNIGLSLSDVTLPDRLRDRLGSGELGNIDGMRLDATLDFDAPIDRHAPDDPPRLQRIDVHDVTLDWGGIALDGEGLIEIAADGFPEGSVALEIRDWQRAVEIAIDAGLIPADQARMVTQGLAFLGGGPSEAGPLELPLRFADGEVHLGPIPLGPAPRFSPAN